MTSPQWSHSGVSPLGLSKWHIISLHSPLLSWVGTPSWLVYALLGRCLVNQPVFCRIRGALKSVLQGVSRYVPWKLLFYPMMPALSACWLLLVLCAGYGRGGWGQRCSVPGSGLAGGRTEQAGVCLKLCPCLRRADPAQWELGTHKPVPRSCFWEGIQNKS